MVLASKTAVYDYLVEECGMFPASALKVIEQYPKVLQASINIGSFAYYAADEMIRKAREDDFINDDDFDWDDEDDEEWEDDEDEYEDDTWEEYDEDEEEFV